LNIQRLNYLWTIRHSSAWDARRVMSRLPGYDAGLLASGWNGRAARTTSAPGGAQLPGDGLGRKVRRLRRRRAAAVTAGTLVLGCRSSFIAGGDWLTSGRSLG